MPIKSHLRKTFGGGGVVSTLLGIRRVKLFDWCVLPRLLSTSGTYERSNRDESQFGVGESTVGLLELLCIMVS